MDVSKVNYRGGFLGLFGTRTTTKVGTGEHVVADSSDLKYLIKMAKREGKPGIVAERVNSWTARVDGKYLQADQLNLSKLSRTDRIDIGGKDYGILYTTDGTQLPRRGEAHVKLNIDTHR